jgi:hypothetical protein
MIVPAATADAVDTTFPVADAGTLHHAPPL